MSLFLSGAIMMACFTVGLFFLHFYHRTRERLFLIFSAAFGMLALERLALAFVFFEHKGPVYILRLLAFVLILIAVVDKNRPQKARFDIAAKEQREPG